jgi:hypothetical protein
MRSYLLPCVGQSNFQQRPKYIGLHNQKADKYAKDSQLDSNIEGKYLGNRPHLLRSERSTKRRSTEEFHHTHIEERSNRVCVGLGPYHEFVKAPSVYSDHLGSRLPAIPKLESKFYVPVTQALTGIAVFQRKYGTATP